MSRVPAFHSSNPADPDVHLYVPIARLGSKSHRGTKNLEQEGIASARCATA